MAKNTRTAEAATAVAEPEKTNQALTERPAGALVQSTQITDEQLQALKDAGIDVGDQTGKEVIDSGDIVPPFVAIAQKTNPQLDPTEGSYIEALKFGQLFNSMTGEIYPEGVQFVPLAIKKHAIEFTPWDEGGGIVDRNVPWDDPRCEWTGEKQEIEPVATRFYDFVVALLPELTLAIISCKVTSFKAGKTLATLIGGCPKAMYLQVYRATCATKKNDQGAFGYFVFQPNGLVTDVPAALRLKSLAEKISTAKVRIEHEAERPADAHEDGRHDTPAGGENIPF